MTQRPTLAPEQHRDRVNLRRYMALAIERVNVDPAPGGGTAGDAAAVVSVGRQTGQDGESMSEKPHQPEAPQRCEALERARARDLARLFQKAVDAANAELPRS